MILVKQVLFYTTLVLAVLTAGLFFVQSSDFSESFGGSFVSVAHAWDGGSGGPGGCCGGGGGGGNGGNTGGPDGGGGGNVFQSWGCTIPNAENYDPAADFDDGSCVIPVPGCTDIFAENYDPNATEDDGSCTYPPVVETTCKLSANATTIENGASVTLTWETEGFDDPTINGRQLSGSSGEVTFENVTEDTTYTLEATNDNDYPCRTTVDIQCLPPVVKECELDVHKSVNKHTAQVGDDVTYTIKVKNIGDGNCTGGGVKIFDQVDSNLIYQSHTLTSNLSAGYGNKPVYSSSDRTLRFNGHTLTPGESGTITWIGEVANPNQCGDFVVKNQAKATAKELNNFQNWEYSQTVKTNIDNDCPVEEPLPKCDYFNASPTSFSYGGGDTTLTWETTDATNVSISGVGNNLALDNTSGREVSVSDTQTFVLTATNSVGEDKSCVQKVTVLPKVEKPLPKCDYFNASPTSFSYGGGDTTLTWETTDATNVSISGVGNNLALDNTNGREVSVSDTQTFVLTAINSEGEDKSCVQKVTVGEKEPVFSCSENVDFTISDTSIRRGDSVDLEWSTVDVDSLSISNINSSALSGSVAVSPSSDTTYTLRAKQDGKTINCPVSVRVSSGGGGGGGGTRTPRCDLEISDKSIEAGEEVALRWKTSNARGVTLKDDRGNVIFTTDDYLSKDKEQYYDGAIKVTPTRDTKYTLNASWGSRDRDCSVRVKVDDETVVLEDRDQKPLVSGISLTQVPYTGFEAGPFMTSLFYALLVAWSLFITYLLVIRKRVAPAAIKTYTPAASVTDSADIAKDSMKQAESVRPDVFTKSTASAATQAAPTNLPTGAPVVGYEAMSAQAATVDTSQSTDDVATQLEDRAHAQKALLSSDAVRHFVAATTDSTNRDELLDQVITEAKQTYPLEDGWIVINQARMQGLCETCVVANPAAVAAAAPTGAGSLAEAIVTGNVVAAYDMIGNRPMIALADAAADLDAVYRNKKGEQNTVSQLLSSQTQNLSQEQLSQMIAALTGALDGTYTDEASAVKMAIMKAVKTVA